MSITARVALLVLALAVCGYGAARWYAGPTRSAIVIGYQTGVDPTKLAQADGLYEKAIAGPLIWRKFDSGSDVITALAAGDIDFGNLGSSPLAIAATRQVPITTIAIISQLGSSEALVVRQGSGIGQPKDLIGKRVAVPFTSTAHYSLLAALDHWGVDDAQVQVLNLSPPQIAAAWSRGDIDAAYVWDPALGTLKRNGTVLAGSDAVAKWGAPTFDIWVVRRDFAKSNPKAVAAFVRVTMAAQQTYRREGQLWIARSREARAIAQITGARADDVPGLLASNDYPSAEQQASSALLGGGLGHALARTAAFLKAQGKVDRVLPDYRAYLDPTSVQQVAEDQKQ